VSKALVMSGGGAVGAGWETGLMAGFEESGLTFTDADLILGTSAGSAAGVLVAASHDLVAQAERYRRAGERHAAGGPTNLMQPDPALAHNAHRPPDLFPRGWAAGPEDPDMKAEVAEISLQGPWALDADAVLRTFRHVAGDTWPANFVCTCFDCDALELVAMDASYGCPLDVGVAASCSIPGLYEPITVHGHRLVDGGVFSPTHLDLAVGYDRVLFINMVPVPEREEQAIAASGTMVRRVEPDERSQSELRDSQGNIRGDISRTFTACVAGREQGRRIAQEIRRYWQA
jgi:NTE family protein